jgi:hypothetical protein
MRYGAALMLRMKVPEITGTLLNSALHNRTLSPEVTGVKRRPNGGFISLPGLTTLSTISLAILAFCQWRAMRQQAT